MLIPVEYNGNQFYLIRTFSKHQHVDKRYIQSFIDMNRVIELKNNLLNLPAERSAQEVEVEVDMEVEVDVEVEKENKDNANALQKETSVSSFTPEYQKFLKRKIEAMSLCDQNYVTLRPSLCGFWSQTMWVLVATYVTFGRNLCGFWSQSMAVLVAKLSENCSSKPWANPDKTLFVEPVIVRYCALLCVSCTFVQVRVFAKTGYSTFTA